ncbi:MAG: DNA polymerase IV [Bacteroidales bacterium]|nr:DNA polymerase IV [Bacteroidales bacterium]
MQNRVIVHMDLDSFFVSVERLYDNSLLNKPIVIGGTSDRGVVAACSYEARKFGVHSAMPIKMAKRLCPNAIYLSGDFDKYSSNSKAVTEIIKENVPLFEKTSIDEFYIDMSGMDKFYSSSLLINDIKTKIKKELGLPISYGISKNKTVSKIATTESKPNGNMIIKYGSEIGFLAPLTVNKIPMVGSVTYKSLRQLGIKYIRTIQELNPQILLNVLGKNGATIWQKANGIDNTPVVPYYDQKSISSERTFEVDTTDYNKLERDIIRMTEQLTHSLRNKSKLTAEVSVKIRYSDFNTNTKQIRVNPSNMDHILIPKVKDIFRNLYNKRLLVRLIGVRFSKLSDGAYQINMFEDKSEMIKLYQTLDKLNNRYGDKTVRRAIGIK